jgi:hypothetical protein
VNVYQQMHYLGLASGIEKSKLSWKEKMGGTQKH